MARTQAANYEERRQAIVDRAAALFAKHGFLGTSIANLAAACKTSKSLLYHYYSSKEDLLYAVMSSHINQLTEELDRVMQLEVPPAEKYADLVQAYMGDYVGAASRQKVLLTELDNPRRAERDIIICKQLIIIQRTEHLRGDMF